MITVNYSYDSFDQHCIPLVKIKDFNALVDNKTFFGQPVKNRQEVCEKPFDTSRNNNYAT